MDNLVTCKRCGSDACYEQQLSENITTWLCMGCGFTTSTQLEKDSILYNQTLESSPELYKDLLFVDNNNRGWFPATITVPEKGMVFIDGTSKDDWKWSAVKAVKIPEEEKNKYPENQEYKMDMKNIKYFERKDFMDALEVINFYSL